VRAAHKISLLLVAGLLIVGCKGDTSKAPIIKPAAQRIDINELGLKHITDKDWENQRSPTWINLINRIIPNTPYSALIIEEGVRVRPYVGPDDDYYEDVRTISAKVIETYRGDPLEFIEFEWTTEGESDEITLRPEPYIITLCKSGNSYFRLEIGADVPATPNTVTTARKISKTLDASQPNFSDCE